MAIYLRRNYQVCEYRKRKKLSGYSERGEKVTELQTGNK